MTPANLEYILYELFAGRATPLQKKLIEGWLREPGNEEVYYYYVAKWETEHRQYDPDTPTALSDYEAFIAGRKPFAYQSQSGNQQPVVRQLNSRWVWRIAASILLVAGLWLTRATWAYERYSVPFGQMRAVPLRDGSTVTLNAHSTLRVPRFAALRRMLGRTDREVWLDGEGFFSIARTTDNQRFVVHTSRLDVQVLGTKFNVSTRRGKTEVVLNEGKVQLFTRPGGQEKPRSLLMQPGDLASLTPGDTLFRKTTVKPEVRTAWRTNRLVFDETPLSQVAQQIEDYYGIRVVIGNRELARRELTGTLPNNDLNVVLKTLSVSYNLAVDRQDDRIILR
ncbi:FecR family protein [Spirosoma montaniterrae]|uniref:Iron dicitrate transport regulator FecR n=1 Tax=Spirosoma montaniterrae TaxID=1178516 RepID=A0A1P9X037_9BACT|nr:FecR domain-containing protein [Spirosoma montaniterrae]AQG80984.1 hypothetical protein AWR27_17635 [Spirosoma montaniterrae]